MSRRMVHFASPCAGPALEVLTAALSPEMDPKRIFKRPDSYDDVPKSAMKKYGFARFDANHDENWMLQSEGWEGLEAERVRELFNLGATYRHVKNKMNDAVLQRFLKEDAESFIEEGCYVRVFVNPRRSNVRMTPANIIVNDDDFVVINKPENLPSVSRADNVCENALFQTEKLLGCNLRPVQRLDGPTQGLMFFAKTLNFTREFNRLQGNFTAIEKHYAFVAEAEKNEFGEWKPFPKAGTRIANWMDVTHPGFRRVSDVPDEESFTRRASLILVEERNMLERDDLKLCKVKLETGRTHQIRAQFGHLGWPLKGDDMYRLSSREKNGELADGAWNCEYFLKCFKLKMERKDGTLIEGELQIDSDELLVEKFYGEKKKTL